MQRHKRTDTRTHRKTDIETDGQTDNRQIDRHKHKHKHTHTHTHVYTPTHTHSLSLSRAIHPMTHSQSRLLVAEYSHPEVKDLFAVS